MPHSYREQVLAFSGIWQAVLLVQKVAREGSVNNDEFAASINTLFVTNPDTTEEVYGSIKNMSAGLNIILKQFGDASSQRDMELTRYVISLMHLERKLAKQPDMLQQIGNGLEMAKSQSLHFSTTHENVIASLADLYANTISTLQPKIIVQGEQGYLSNPGNAAKVRALLLAGIRSTVLWRQCGGRRIKLLFNRKKMLQQAKELLNDIQETAD